jgi:glyoxylase-like metal-dependent hydrolase (beta-lactamase superfamily II)
MGERIVMVDAGAPGQSGAFARAIARIPIRPDEIELVVITHGHLDHIGTAQYIKRITNAQIAIHRAEREWLESGRPPLPPGVTAWGRIMIALAKWVGLDRQYIPATGADISLDDDGLTLRAYGVPGEIIHTPGHSRGSVSVLLDSGEAFVGDMAMSARWLRLTPGLPAFAENVDQVKESWARLLQAGARTVFPAHGEPFPADVIRLALARSRW